MMGSIDRKKALVLSLALLALVSLPVSANAIGAIGSIHQSDDDFGEAALENMTISGTGDDASVVLDGETDASTAETSFHGSIGTNFQAAAGVMIKPNDDLAGLRINLASTSEATMAELRQGDGTTIERTSISEGSAEFSADLNAGEEYQVVADADGSEYNASFDDDPSLPYVSDNIDITNGVLNDEPTDDTIYNIDNVTAVVSGGSGEYVSQSHFVDDSTGASANITHIQDSDASLIVEEWDGSDWHVLAEKQGITTEGQTTLEWDEDASSELRTRVAVDPTDVNNEFELEQEAILFDDSEPQLTSPEPNTAEVITESPVGLSIDVEDADFGTAQGDEVTVEFRDASDDSTIGTETLTENGTANTDWSTVVGGTNQWYVVASDDYGNSVTSDTFSFKFPSELEIRNESSPEQLVEGTESEVTVRFFAEDEDEVIERTTTDGIVDLEGLEDRPFSVEVEADGFVRRQALIDSIADQQTVYLLPDNVETATVRFRIDDETGQFDESSSQLFVQRPITRDGSTFYETVAADDFGPNGFTTTIEADQRYRLLLRNNQGDERILEPYSAAVDESVTLDVDSVSYRLDVEEEFGWQFVVEGEEDENTQNTVRFALSDESQETENVNVKIYERGNESNVLLDETYDGPFGDLTVTQQVPESENATQWAVEWSATRGGEEITAQRFAGERGIVNISMPDWLEHALSVIIILLVAGLGSQVNAPTVGVGVVFVASVLWFIGWLPTAVTGGVLAFALAIPALYLISGNGGVR